MRTLLPLLLIAAGCARAQTAAAWEAEGVRREAAGDFSGAERAYRKALSAAASSQERAVARAMLVTILLRNASEEACGHLPALRQDAEEFIPLLALAGAEKMCRGPQSAIPYFERALALSEARVAARISLNLCLALSEAGRYAEALRVWEKAAVSEPMIRPVGQIVHARALAENGSAAPAAMALREALPSLDAIPLTAEEKANLWDMAARVFRLAGAKHEAKESRAAARRLRAETDARATVHVSELARRR
jgi:tetratricopeptide (TPR) repeat protein